MLQKDVVKLLIFRTIGNFLLLLSIAGFVLTFGEAFRQELSYRINILRGVHFVVLKDIPASQFDKPVGKDAAQPLIAKDIDFSILIPKIGASARVFPNVDPANYDEYMKILQKGVAHAQGTGFPGMKNNIYLFAHSTDNFWNVGRYNAVFYLLKEVEPGDGITLVFAGRRFDYLVFEKKIVEANDVSYLSQKPEEGEVLTLQTCWPPGTTWKRLLIFAKPAQFKTLF